MADHSAVKAKNATLTGTTADVVTLTGTVPVLRVTNRHATEVLWFKYGSDDEGSFAAAADDTQVVLPMTSVEIRYGANGIVVRVLGNANPYSIAAIPVTW